MATNVSNLVLGTANLYVATFGTTETGVTTLSSLSTAPTGGWTAVGATSDGVTLTIKQSYTELEADQVLDVAGNRLTKREMTIETNLAELTLANLQTALNGGSIATGTGTSTFDPGANLSGAEPAYSALIIDGVSPGGKPRRVIVRKALQTGDVQFAYKKGDQSMYSVAFAAHYVDGVKSPFIIVDAS